MEQLPGEELAKKVWETIADNGIGGLFKTWQIRRVGRAITDAQVDNKLRIAQAERDVEAIRNGEAILEGNSSLKLTYNSKSNSNSDSSSHVVIAQDISATLIADAARKEINVAKAILHAETAAMENQGAISEEAVNPDWLFRWRDSAGEVSNEELQTLWGKILAGEVKSPGAFSLRTLDSLRNISKQEAELIARLAPYITSGFMWRTDELKSKEINYGYMLKMQELGILNGVEAVGGLQRTVPSVETEGFCAALIGADRALIVQHDDPKKSLQIPCYALTSTGEEILKLCSSQSDKEYLRSLGKKIAKDGFSVLIATYRDNGNQGITWWKEEEIKLPEATETAA